MDNLSLRIQQACQQSMALQNSPQAAAIGAIVAAAIAAVDPYQAVLRAVQRDGDYLRIGEQSFDLRAIRRLKAVGMGKAGRAMLQALNDALGDRLAGGMVIAKHAAPPYEEIGRARLLAGGHPAPDANSIEAGRQLLAELEGGTADDLTICLISGGGSALAAAPAEGIALADLQALTNHLLACGATVNEINCLRKHLDRVKGGGVARQAAPARLVSLILSDVIGSPLDVIASGPSVPDPSTYADAWQIIQKYHLEASLPPAIGRRLQRGLAGDLPETLKPGDPIFARTTNLVVGSNDQAAQAALARARQFGYHTLLLSTYLQGEARSAGQFLAAIARQIAASGEPLPRPACLVAGGETTVTLHGSGKGGRNQELALGAAAELAGLPETVLLSFGTDGEDGPTDAAGAAVTGETLGRAASLGLKPALFLQNNDAYHFFASLGDLLRPGPTGTNVNDLTFLFSG